MEELRWALDRGTAPVLITSAVAGGLRSLARFKSAPRGMRDADLMREVELTTNLIVAATASDGPLPVDEIDRILGVSGDTA